MGPRRPCPRRPCLERWSEERDAGSRSTHDELDASRSRPQAGTCALQFALSKATLGGGGLGGLAGSCFRPRTLRHPRAWSKPCLSRCGGSCSTGTGGGRAPGVQSRRFQKAAIVAFAQEAGWPLLAEPASGLSGPLIPFGAEAFLRKEDPPGHPDLILRVGRSPTAGPVSRFLQASGRGKTWLVEPSGRLLDGEGIEPSVEACSVESALSGLSTSGVGSSMA